MLAILFASLWPANASAATRDRYAFNVTLDVDSAIASVRQRITFTNRADVPLDMIEMLVPAVPSGAFHLRGARVGGRTASASVAGAGLRLSGLDPIARGVETTVELEYDVRVPRPGSIRLGRQGETLVFGSWYAALFPLDPGGWRTHAYTEDGDAFVADSIDVEFNLLIDRDVTLVAPGLPVAAGSGRVFSTRVSGARDYAFVVGPRLSRAEGQVGATQVVAHGRAGDEGLTRAVARATTEYASWLSQRIGPLPHDRVDIVTVWSARPDQVGQEYDRIVFLNRAQAAEAIPLGSYFSYLIAHEVTHFWFHGLVGSDPVREPWLDEALATYLPERFFSETNPDIGASRLATLRRRVGADASRIGTIPIDTPLPTFADENTYFAIVYRRGAAFLDDLWKSTGDATFWRAMRDYVERSRGRIATAAEFHAAFDRAAAANLSPVRARYLRGAAITSIAGDDGRFFDETGGFTVSNAEGIPFWDEFRALGGVDALGYPVSRRFTLDGFTVQAFQKAILQWRPEVRRAYFVNVLDRLSQAGQDDWLLVHRMTPRPSDSSPDTGLAWERVVARRQAMLDIDPTLRSAYFAVPNSIDRYGLPVSAADVGNAIVVRCQRAVLQRWKTDVPWARAGQVTIANAGDLAKEAGLLPSAAVVSERRA